MKLSLGLQMYKTREEEVPIQERSFRLLKSCLVSRIYFSQKFRKLQHNPSPLVTFILVMLIKFYFEKAHNDL